MNKGNSQHYQELRLRSEDKALILLILVPLKLQKTMAGREERREGRRDGHFLRNIGLESALGNVSRA